MTVGIPILNLPSATGLSGDEWLAIVQGGTTKRTQVSDIAILVENVNFADPGVNSFFGWIDSEGIWRAITKAESQGILGIPTTTTDDQVVRFTGTTGSMEGSALSISDDGSMLLFGTNVNLGLSIFNLSTGGGSYLIYAGANGGGNPGGFGIFEGGAVNLNSILITALTGAVQHRGNISPMTSDAASLGTAALQYSDLFLAEGGVINWDNGDATLTQTGDKLSYAAGSATLFEINANAAALPAPPAGTIFHIGAADSAQTAFYFDGFAIAPAVAFRRADGTAAAPSALQANEQIGALNWVGYGATGYSSGTRGAVGLSASQIWTDANQGTYMRFFATPTNSTAVAEKLRLTGDGVLRPGTSDQTSLGDASFQWSDLFLAEGGVINWDNGDATLTQAGNVITVAGAGIRSDNFGFSSGVDPSSVYPFYAKSTTAFLPQILLWSDANDTSAAISNFHKSRLGGPVQVNDGLGSFNFAGLDSGSTSMRNAASISATATAVAATTVDAYLNFNVNLAGVAQNPLRVTTSEVSFNKPATPRANDGAALGTTALQWSDLFLAEGGVINWDNGDVTITQTNNSLDVAGFSHVGFKGAGTNYLIVGDLTAFVGIGIAATSTDLTVGNYMIIGNTSSTILSAPTGGSIFFRINNVTTTGMTLTATAFSPSANDSGTLGTTALQWSDLFLAEGGVINWDNGDATLTQTGNTITWAGIDNYQLPASTYLNWGATAGVTGYGIRDSGGTMQAKSSGAVNWGYMNPRAIANVTSSQTLNTQQSGQMFINNGSTLNVVLTLPLSAEGVEYHFWIYDADGITVDAPGGEFIWGTSVTTAGGTIYSTQVGNQLSICGIGGSIWAITRITTGWTFT